MNDLGENNQDKDKVHKHLTKGIPPGTPPARADSIRKDAWQQFKKNHGQEWRVSWDKEKGLPTSIFLGTTKAIPGGPEKVAKTFLGQHRTLFGMQEDLNDLNLIEVDISSRGMRHVRFQQTYKGIPIHKATYQVHIRPDGRIDMANGNYYKDVEVSTSSSVGSSSAEQTALSDLGGNVELQNQIETTKMIYYNSTEDNFSLAWKVLISSGEPSPGEWQYFIDAANGQILDKSDLVTTITGDGDIIESHPGITPTPIIKNLYRLDGSGYLRGDFANVHNHKNNRAHSSNNSFNYDISSTHFDEVNVYYHIDTFRAGYLSNLGFNAKIGSDYDLEAWVHDLQRPYDAYYNPNNEEVRFGDYVDYAKEDKVIYHEFIHAVADVKNGSHYLDPNPTEEGAIGEGIADYFSGAYTGRAQTGNWVLTNPRDMANPDIDTYSSYINNNSVPVHAGGEFFSAILWDLRTSGNISPHDADILIYEAIGRLSGGPNFIGFRNAMMAEDDFINGGSHNDLIQDVFAARGVGDFDPPTVSISGPPTLIVGTSDTFTANASGGLPPYQYQWYYRHESEPNWTLAPGATSSSYSYTAGAPSREYVKVVVTDSRGSSNEVQHTINIFGQCC